MRSRTALINFTRGVVKSMGQRVPSSSASSFLKAVKQLPDDYQDLLLPVTTCLETLTAEISRLEYRMDQMAREQFPDALRLQEVPGVGPVTSLAYVLTLEDPHRFASSRMVGPYLGLTTRRDQSGDRDPQLRITKAGDTYLRRLLVGCAQHILGEFGQDSALRQWGLGLASGGSHRDKKRAVVAVARERLYAAKTQVRQELATLREEARRLAMTLGSGNGSEAPINTRLAEIEETVRKLERRAAEIEAQWAVATEKEVSETALRDALGPFDPVWEMLNTPERVRIVKTVVERLSYNGETNKLEIRFSPKGINLLSQERQKEV